MDHRERVAVACEMGSAAPKLPDAVLCKTTSGRYVLSAWSAKYITASNVLSKAGLWSWVASEQLPAVVSVLRLAGLTVEVEGGARDTD